MGLFDKIKKMFKTSDEEEIIEEEVQQESVDAEEPEEIIEEETQIEETSEEDTEDESDVVIEEEVVEEKPVEKKKTKKDKKKPEKKEDKKKDIKIYEKGLSKSREGFVSKLANLTNKYKKVTDEYFEELEEILIMADIGVNTVMDFIDRLRDRVRKEHLDDPSELKEIIVDELFIIYVNDEILTNKINFNENDISVILFVGVNGVGKTTTIAKIASKLKTEGKKVMMVAGDTFRAGAIEQLHEWANRAGVEFYGKEENTDPSSVLYDGIEAAKEKGCDVVLVDTAGRLQNKVNLMNELEKMNNVVSKLVDGGCSETLLVIDAGTGQNGINQAKAFKEITNITGIVLTKMDGTAKGGIVLAIKEEVGIPVKYIGLGERKEDLVSFDIEKYIYGLFKDMM